MKYYVAVSMLFALVILNKHALHMFQQNRYECGRYHTWMKANPQIVFHDLKSVCIVYILVFALRYTSMNMDYVCIGACILIGLLGINQERKQEYIKPLVYTGRVKRQIVVLNLLEFVFFTWMYTCLHEDIHFVVLIFLLFVYQYIYVMAVCTSPIESLVKKWYLNDAKKILNSHSSLVKIGITGSYGKTTTKNVMKNVLSNEFQTLMTPASYNTPMGITRTIREMLKPIDEVFVCEMGADHVKEITYLMNFVQPSIGVVTSIGPQHLQTFGSFENIIYEKMQEIELLPSDGLGVLNYDNEYIRNYNIKNNVAIVSYGIEQENVDYRAVNIRFTKTGSKFDVCYKDEVIPFETKLLGELNILNILSAIAVSRHLNVSWSTIQKAVRDMQQVEHRLEMKRINNHLFIDDAFNSNPSGSKMALDVLSRMEGCRFIVTPGMIDLGEIQDKVNYEFGMYMKDRCDVVILVGKKQTEKIYEGLRDSGFDMERVAVVDSVKQGFTLLYRKADQNDPILLENDLPDAFSN